MNVPTEREIALIQRIRDLEVRLKRAQNQAHAQKQRALHWRTRALTKTKQR